MHIVKYKLETALELSMSTGNIDIALLVAQALSELNIVHAGMEGLFFEDCPCENHSERSHATTCSQERKLSS